MENGIDSQPGDAVELKLGPLSLFNKHQVKNLGVMCDSALKFDKQIN